MKIKRRIILIFLMALYPLVCFSQEDYEWFVYEADPVITGLVVEGSFFWASTYSNIIKTNKITGELTFFDHTNSDIPPGRVMSMAVDENGDKWFGIDMEGLTHFDGSNWTTYNTSNSNLPSDRVWSIAIDDNGDIWVGTEEYMSKFDGNSFRNYYVYPSILIYALVIDDFGNKWLGTNAGMFKFNGVSFTHYHDQNSGIPYNLVYRIAKGKNNEIWAGTIRDGIAMFDGANWTLFDKSTSDLPDNNINTLESDNDGNIWVGTKNGLAKYNGSEWTVYYTTNSGIPENYITAFFVDENNNKWIGTPVSGVALFDDTKWTVYRQSNSELPGNSISSIAIDKMGDKWIGTLGRTGFAKFDGSEWTTYKTEMFGIPEAPVNTMAVDLNNHIWIGTRDGLVDFDGTDWKLYDKSNSDLPNSTIKFIKIDNSGVKWLCTPGGLASFNGTDWTAYTTSNSGLPNKDVKCIAFDSKGDKWIGCNNGYISRFDGTNWTIYDTTVTNLPSVPVLSIAISENGDKWIASSGGGIVKFDGNDWVIYDSTNTGLPYDGVNEITIDDNGNLWISTQFCGFAKFNGADWIVYDQFNSGLPDGSVRCVTVDNKGNKWIGTAVGMGFYSEKIYCERIEGTFCGGDSFDVSFTAEEIFNPDNEFSVQLSDENGIFHNDSIPKVIGTLSSRSSGTVQVTIPQGVEIGDKYRVRISGSSPFARGVDNGKDLSVASKPEPELSGDEEVLPGSLERYISGSFDNNYWSATGGVIEDSSSKSIKIRWASPGSGSVTLKMINENGCADSVTQNINISIPDLTLSGDAKVCEYSTEQYSTIRLAGGEVVWTVESGGSIVGGNTGDTVEVQWDGPGQGSLKLSQLINSYPKDKVIEIEILTQPSKPTIVRNGNDLRSSSTSGNQWFHNDTIIPGANGQTFSPTDYGGFFQVQVTGSSGCISEISDKFDYEYIPRASFRIADGSDISAEAGTDVQLPINVVPIDNISPAGVSSVRARIRFNANILIPTSAPFGTINGDERVISLDMPVTQDNKLTSLNLRATLGNASSTEIIMDSIELVGGIWELEENTFSINFTLEGVCTEGGLRLVGPGGMAALYEVYPNPASGKISIRYVTSEKGMTQLLLFNSMGRTVMTLHKGSISRGRHEKLVDLKDIPSGVYYLVLQTPSRRRAVRLDIVK